MNPAIVCYICNTDADLIRIPGRREIYVCQSDLEKHTNSLSTIALTDNDICRDCLLNPVAFIYIAESPFKKYCNSCASTLKTNTPGNEKVFISINWKKIVKGQDSIDKYKAIKAKIKVVKKKCQNFIKNFEEEVKSLEIEHYNAQVFSTIDTFFDSQNKILEDYQQEYIQGYKNFLKNLKSDIICRKQSNNKGFMLIGSKEEQNNLKYLKLAEIEYKPNFNDDFFFGVKLKQLNELIYSEYFYYFCEEKPNIFEFSTKNLEVVKYNGPGFVPWKHNSCWCEFENGDILYTGGVYNKKESGKCFLVNPRKDVINCINNCEPRQGHTLVVYEDNAYLFGGNTEISQKFIHKENTWQLLANTPKVLKQATSVYDNGTILMTGSENDQIFFYSIRNNAFLEVGIKVIPKQKLLLRINEKIYLLIENNVFLFDTKGLILIKKQDSNMNKNTSITEPKISNNRVYWVTIDGELCYFCEKEEKTFVERQKNFFLKL